VEMEAWANNSFRRNFREREIWGNGVRRSICRRSSEMEACLRFGETASTRRSSEMGVARCRLRMKWLTMKFCRLSENEIEREGIVKTFSALSIP